MKQYPVTILIRTLMICLELTYLWKENRIFALLGGMDHSLELLRTATGFYLMRLL